MDQTLAQGYVSESIKSIAFFTILALCFNLYVKARNFFFIPYPLIKNKRQYPSFYHVAICFGIYLGFSAVIAPVATLFIRWFRSSFLGQTTMSLPLLSGLQLSTTLMILTTLFIFIRKQNPQMIRPLWKDFSIPTSTSIIKDFFSGAAVWLLGFPVVAVTGQICDLLSYLIFGMQPYEQVAVRYLKMTLSSMPMLFVALFSILIAAPVIEEFLFRGMLQSWLKSRLGTKASILLSSLAFSLFHMAASQGLGNISVVVSLFSFACFLGFIYEKRGSLFASIGLHMTFNTISTFRILFFPES